jgi:hypothetical protein
MSQSVTHVVGPYVVFRALDRIIQRCAICGEKLEDIRPSRVAVVSTNGNNDLPIFPEGHLIRVTEGNPKEFVILGDFAKGLLPDDFCLSLVEEP